MVDFSLTKLRHQARKMRIKLFLEDKAETIPSDTESFRDCGLGKWIYSDGLNKYGKLTEVQRLEKVHAEVHAVIKRVIELKQAGNQTKAEQEFESLEPISQELLSLLAAVEQKVQQKAETKG